MTPESADGGWALLTGVGSLGSGIHFQDGPHGRLCAESSPRAASQTWAAVPLPVGLPAGSMGFPTAGIWVPRMSVPRTQKPLVSRTWAQTQSHSRCAVGLRAHPGSGAGGTDTQPPSSPWQESQRMGGTVDRHVLTVSPVTSLSPDGRCRTREAGGLRAAAGARSGRVPDQQERRPTAVLCSTPRALAGTPWAPNASGMMGGDRAHSRPPLPGPMWSVPLLLLVPSIPPASKGVHLTGSRVGSGQEQG